MWNFIDQLFKLRRQQVTILLMEESHPDETHVYSIRPKRLFWWTYVFLFLGAILMLSLLILTPLGNYFAIQYDENLRFQAYELQERLIALEDSLAHRDQYLASIKSIIIEGGDTMFEVNSALRTNSQANQSPPVTQSSSILTSEESGSQTNRLSNSVFFIEAPVPGKITRNFDETIGHFGIDLALQTGSKVKNVAPGIVVQSEWTMNFGYVIFIHHGGGYMTAYKHLQHSFKKVGDVVTKGDILGLAGDAGIISSGPHLHFEIWYDGVPQNPERYLINL